MRARPQRQAAIDAKARIGGEAAKGKTPPAKAKPEQQATTRPTAGQKGRGAGRGADDQAGGLGGMKPKEEEREEKEPKAKEEEASTAPLPERVRSIMRRCAPAFAQAVAADSIGGTRSVKWGARRCTSLRGSWARAVLGRCMWGAGQQTATRKMDRTPTRCDHLLHFAVKVMAHVHWHLTWWLLRLQVALKFEHRSSKGCNYGPPYEWSVYRWVVSGWRSFAEAAGARRSLTPPCAAVRWATSLACRACTTRGGKATIM